MIRWFIQVLVCMFALQSAWAATHVCEPATDHLVQHVKKAATLDDSDLSGSADSSSDRCSGAHCHALHAPALATQPLVVQLDGSSPIPSALALREWGRICTPIDRPNWMSLA